MAIFIYVDNSNLWIEGQYLHACRAGLTASRPDAHGRAGAARWSYDFGKLYQSICPPGETVGRAALFGSRPPANDSLWTRAQANGFEVQIFERNAANREKQVDTGLATLMVADCYGQMDPSGSDRVVLVAGDGDFVPPVREVRRRGVPVQVVFWTHATSQALRREATGFVALDPHLDRLTRTQNARINCAGGPGGSPIGGISLPAPRHSPSSPATDAGRRS